MKEVWKRITGFEDYMVSDYGNIKSYKKNREGCVLAKNKRGQYDSVVLIGDDKRQRASIHRLVADAFIPNPHNLPFINHKNGDKKDNRVDNLEWCSPSQNTQHYYNVLKKGKLLKDQAVIQYTKNGKYIRSWDSVREASEETGCTIDNIVHSCKRRNRRKTTNGFLWRFVGDNDLNTIQSKDKRVVMINKYGEEVQRYDSSRIASESTGISLQSIQKICAMRQWQAEDNSIWRYEDTYSESEFAYYKDKTFIKMNSRGIRVCEYNGIKEVIDDTNGRLMYLIRHLAGDVDSFCGFRWCIKEEGDISREQKRRKAVVCLDKEMRYVCDYETISNAAMSMQCQPIHISIACRDIKKSCRGFRWMYKVDYDNWIKDKQKD